MRIDTIKKLALYWWLILSSIFVTLAIINLVTNGAVDYIFPIKYLTGIEGISTIVVVNIFSQKIVNWIESRRKLRLISTHSLALFAINIGALIFTEYLFGNDRQFTSSISGFTALYWTTRQIVFVFALFLLALKVSKVASRAPEKQTDKYKLWFWAIIISACVSFAILTFSLPLLTNGSFPDDYYHLFSARQLIQTGQLPQIYGEAYYNRGLYVTYLVELAFRFLGDSLVVAKVVPATAGLLSLVIFVLLAKRLIRNPIIIIVSVIAYAFTPWVILNHFFVRMYAFYELFLLSILLLYFLIDEAIRNKQYVKGGVLFIVFGLINAVAILLSNDAGAYMIGFASAILVIFLFVRHYKDFKFINIKYVALLVFVFGILGSIVIDPVGKLAFLINTQTPWTSGQLYKYGNLFINLMPLITALAVVPALALKKYKDVLPVIAITGSLFVVHIYSAPDLQLTRSITYLLPMFFLLAGVTLSSLQSSRLALVSLIALLLITVVINYPRDFLSSPYVPGEIPARDFSDAYTFSNYLCEDKIIYTAQWNPWILLYFNPNAKVFAINTVKETLAYTNDYKFDESTGSYFTTHGNIPVITGDVISRVTTGGPSCLITFNSYNSAEKQLIGNFDYSYLTTKFYNYKRDFSEVTVYTSI